MEKEHLEEILGKIINNTATEEELGLYSAWCNAMQRQDIAPDETDINNIQQEMLQNIHRQIKTPKAAKHRLLKQNIAAAIVIGIIGTGIFILLHKDRHTMPNTAQAAAAEDTIHTAVLPGKNAATLTLADGSKINLSAVNPGQIALENGAVISKTPDNRLIYRFKEDTTGKKTSANLLYNTLTTTGGEQCSITLPDGTAIWLNAASSLTFPVTFSNQAKREVRLSGEAYFEVTENKRQPFAVLTSKQYIEDLGTHFDVSCYADDPSVKTTLLEGSVRINHREILKPGQQAVTTTGTEVKIGSVNTRAAIAWKNGYFEFDDENIYSIMKQVARWYNVEVIYSGKMPLSTMRGSMTRFAGISDVLNVIQQTGLFTFKTEQRKIYVSNAIHSPKNTNSHENIK